MVLVTCCVFDRNYSFLTNLFQKVNIVSLSWNLMLRLIRICRVQWWSLHFVYLTEHNRFGPVFAKLFAQSKIWYLDYFESEEISGDSHFFCFCLEVCLFGKVQILNLDWFEYVEFSFICKTVSQFFEISIFSQDIWGNVQYVPEINLIS